MKYKNISGFVLNAQGVTFNPGEVKDVPMKISSKHFIRIDETKKPTEKPSQPVQKSNRGRKPKQVVDLKSETTSEPKIVQDDQPKEADKNTNKKEATATVSTKETEVAKEGEK